MTADELTDWLLAHPEKLAAIRELYPDGVWVTTSDDGAIKLAVDVDIVPSRSVWVDADNPKPRPSGYINVYPTHGGAARPSLKAAAGGASRGRIGVIAVYADGIEVVEGARP